jgi:hypothetical protein
LQRLEVQRVDQLADLGMVALGAHLAGLHDLRAHYRGDPDLLFCAVDYSAAECMAAVLLPIWTGCSGTSPTYDE